MYSRINDMMGYSCNQFHLVLEHKHPRHTQHYRLHHPPHCFSSLFNCFSQYPLPGRHHFKLLLTMCGLLHFILLVLFVSPTICIMKLFNNTYFVCTILAMSIFYFFYNIKICILHCHYDCLLLSMLKNAEIKPNSN